MGERIVSIFGTGRAAAGDSAYELAYAIGWGLAKKRIAIANGGYRGTMLAAAKGAAEAGGEVIGVTCSAFKGRANKYVTRQIVAKRLEERLATVVRLWPGDN